MAHDPRNPYCHYPPRKCICTIVWVRPEASPLAPALLAWVDTASLHDNISVKTAWLSAAVHFQREGVGELFPDSTAEFVDILDYAAPLFDTERGIALDTSHAESDGIIEVSRGEDFEPPGGLIV